MDNEIDKDVLQEFRQLIDNIETLKEKQSADKNALYGTLLNTFNSLELNEKQIENLQNFCAAELEQCISQSKQQEIDSILQESLEYLVDLVGLFSNEKLINLVKQTLELKFSKVKYYALNTLLKLNAPFDKNVVLELANDVEVAYLLFELLSAYDKEKLFPKKLKNNEHLAKSQMISWLVYPTEMGMVPEEIHLLGIIKKHGEVYYIWKFRHKEFLNNEWYVGWSGNDDVFSDFDEELSQILKEKNGDKKVFKNLKRTL